MRHGYVIVIAFGSLFSQISSKSELIIAHLPRDIEQSKSEITRATFFHVRIAAGHLSGLLCGGRHSGECEYFIRRVKP